MTTPRFFEAVLDAGNAVCGDSDCSSRMQSKPSVASIELPLHGPLKHNNDGKTMNSTHPPTSLPQSKVTPTPIIVAGQSRGHRSGSMLIGPSGHTSHAMVLHMQEYRDRVHNAFQSTYQVPLQLPKKPENGDAHKRRRSKGYCRSHVLQTNKTFFHVRDTTPSHFAAPVNMKDSVLRKTNRAYVNFHQQCPRKDEYLFGDHAASRPRTGNERSSLTGVAKDHFALGPGQYDIANIRPKTMSVKFSPSDRFHEQYSADIPGPGEYITSEMLTTPRPASAVFSQMPRQTDMALVVSPTANVASSYYYMPVSEFSEPNAPENDHANWTRSPRLSGRRTLRASAKLQAVMAQVDYLAKNKQEIELQSAALRARKAAANTSNEDFDEKKWDDGREARILVSPIQRGSLYIRRSVAPATLTVEAAILYSATRATSNRSIAIVHPNGDGEGSLVAARTPDQLVDAQHTWLPLVYVTGFHTRLIKQFRFTAVLRQLLRVQQDRTKCVVFTEWKRLNIARSRLDARELLARNAFRYRLHLRIQQKTAHVRILRSFLGGLSIDVRFAIAMKKIKRKITHIQRWWRHVQLMVKAREEALFYKWISVESRLRLEYVSQMPHVQRIFQPPVATSLVTSSLGQVSSQNHRPSSSHGSELQLHKLLNLPDQGKWFTARFVLTSDGCLRGFAHSDAKELLVEVKNFRCHCHADVGSPEEAAYNGNGLDDMSDIVSSAQWKPFLMVFRQGALRFVLLSSLSQLPMELYSWKDKLDRFMLGSGGGMNNVSSNKLLQSSQKSLSSTASSSEFSSSVGELVEVLSSGILSSADRRSSFAISTAAGVNHTTPPLSPGSSLRSAGTLGKLQVRMQSIRQRGRGPVNVTDGELAYYVVDLLKDMPKVPSTVIWQTIRDKLRDKRRSFRAEIYRYKLEMFHYHQHQEQVKDIQVLDKFREFFVRAACYERFESTDSHL